MASWCRKLVYFALGSAAVGTIFGLGFAVNLGGRVCAEDEERRRWQAERVENLSGHRLRSRQVQGTPPRPSFGPFGSALPPFVATAGPRSTLFQGPLLSIHALIFLTFGGRVHVCFMTTRLMSSERSANWRKSFLTASKISLAP